MQIEFLFVKKLSTLTNMYSYVFSVRLLERKKILLAFRNIRKVHQSVKQ